ncbi:Mss4-like protein [Elsinoe ampelina]|uniref:Mss4-like protein n=1 Tax=Elsinoe ampelina TaxID=302913 RepID=A0A6A6GNL0_9PEZI|nr:Mss4-like protein [Elsinoe ampelina]
MSVRDADKSAPYIPLSGATSDGTSDGTHATATCFCGSVQYRFPLAGIKDVFVCHCTDCHKLHSAMFGTNFILSASDTVVTRGQDKLKTYATKKSIAAHRTMTNHFCEECGTLMWRTGEGFPGVTIPRAGTVDDFNLMERELRPRVEMFVKDRAAWIKEVDGVVRADASHY